MTWTRLCEFNESHWHWHGETNTMRQVEQVEQQPSIPYVVPKLCTRRMSCHRSLNETQLDHGKTAKCTRSPLSPSCFKPPTIARTGRPWIYCCLHCPTLSCPVSSYCSILKSRAVCALFTSELFLSTSPVLEALCSLLPRRL